MRFPTGGKALRNMSDKPASGCDALGCRVFLLLISVNSEADGIVRTKEDTWREAVYNALWFLTTGFLFFLKRKE